ncbi:hypothetical protein B0H10DRAFT_1950747 [Mycena sp. CBHHK59/15]|nr:hypothetical protein B0H10DRAFT_1950747 [Mycena sp. CBHHK59/15]
MHRDKGHHDPTTPVFWFKVREATKDGKDLDPPYRLGGGEIDDTALGACALSKLPADPTAHQRKQKKDALEREEEAEEAQVNYIEDHMGNNGSSVRGSNNTLQHLEIKMDQKIDLMRHEEILYSWGFTELVLLEKHERFNKNLDEKSS